MISTAIVIFREVLEIAIILSVILAATTGLDGRWKWILTGILGGIAGSALVAIFASAISDAAEGLGQELFNAGILLTAAAVIGGTALWMSKHAREMTRHLRHISNEVIDGHIPFYSLAVVITLAILREGAEIVLFINGMIASGQEISSIMTGSILGFLGGATLGFALYMGLVSISPKHIFSVTTWLLIFLCAGMSATAAKFLSSAGLFENLSMQVWDTSFALTESSLAGQTLHALFGYTAQPLAIQLVFYVVTILTLIAGKKLINRKPTILAK